VTIQGLNAKHQLTHNPRVLSSGGAGIRSVRRECIRIYLPRFRKPWMSEDYRMSIFDAIAFGMAFLSAKR
jgi:hypothetical protein